MMSCQVQTKEESLLALTQKTGYSMIQENGQRRYGGPPPNWEGPAPPKGCEIFVGKIPRDCFEDELVPVFETVGKLYELRLMMDFSGTNRGFAFVMYEKPDCAKEAVRRFDNYEIRKGKFLGVCKSVDNCRLFVGGIPKTKLREEDLTKEESLLALVQKTGYSMIQENGQRRYGGPPPDWEGPAPPKGSEIFVGKIPRDCFEDELVPIFEMVGKLYELRLMMDFSGTNRGFAFVTYENPDCAKEAVRIFNNYEIRRRKFLGVCKSIDNCRLFVGGIPKTKLREEVFEEMTKVTDGVVNVILYPSISDKTKSRGFAFVEYDSHRAAAMARRKLIPGRIQLWGQDIAVDWAEPEPEIDEETMSKVTILYVRNLMLTTTEDQLRDIFTMDGLVTVEKVKKLKDYAFVHFKLREDAENAMQKFNGKNLDGSVIEVTWAKPADRSRTRQTAPVNRSNYLNSLAYSSQFNGPYFYGGVPTAQQFEATNPYALFQYPPPMASITPHQTFRNTFANSRGGFRGRGRGAGGMRGNLGYGGGRRKASEMHLCDLQPGMELIPTNPYTLKPTKAPTQALLELAQKNNWGEPVYQLHSAVSSDPNNRDPVQLFLYKVTFPNFQTLFTPTKLTVNIDEAKQIAAEHVLLQCGLPMDDLSSSFASSLSFAGAQSSGALSSVDPQVNLQCCSACYN